MLAPPHPTMDGWPDREPNRPGFPPLVEAPHLRMEDATHLLTGLKILARAMDGCVTWKLIVWIPLQYWLLYRLGNRDPEISLLMKISQYNWVGFHPFYGFCYQYLAFAWRNIPFRKWLISMVILNRLKIGLWDPFQMAWMVCKWKLLTTY